MDQKPKLRFYKHFKITMCKENYIIYNLQRNERSILAQLRMGILPLTIETGRFINQPLEQRLCKICDSNEVEDEWHFIFPLWFLCGRKRELFHGYCKYTPGICISF